MADARATFAVELDTQGLVKPGDEAVHVLEKLKSKIRGDVEALAAMNTAMRNLKGGSSVNVAAFKQLRDQIAAQKQAVASAQADYVNLGGKLTDLTKKAFTGSDGIGTLSDAAGVASGPLGRMIGHAGGLIQKLGKGGLAAAALLGAAAIIALSTALAIAIGAATAALVKYGIASANAARSELLHLQGLTTIRNWYGLAAGKASDLQDAINNVSASSALGRDQVGKYAEQLYKMGLRGANLSDALEGTAIKASVQGEAYAGMFMGMAAGANLAGGSVKKLADDVRARLGGIAKAQALDLNVQIAKLHESWAQLFQGVNIEPFLKGLNEVTQLFSQNTSTGKGLKIMIETLFTPLVGQLGGLGTLMKKTFQYGVIGLQTIVIWTMRASLWLKRTFGIKLTWFDLFKAALGAAADALGVFATALSPALGGVASFAGFMAQILTTVLQLKADLVGQSWHDVGTTLVKSFGQGINDGIGFLAHAVGALGKAAADGLRNALNMHSPSPLFIGMGAMVDRSFAMGMDRGRPFVSQSVSEMVQIPSRVGVPRGGTSGGKGVTISELHYHAGPGESPQSISANTQHLRDEIAKVLEGLGSQIGAAA